jgi:aspartate aminotransferase
MRDGRRILRLGLGQSPFPVPQAVQDELKANSHQKDYLPVLGLRELRTSIVEHLRRHQSTTFVPENVIVGPGSKELMFLLQLTYYGDLLIPTPSWVSYGPQAHIIGRHIVWIPTKASDSWRVTPDALERVCRADPGRPRLMILNYPANPHGGTYTEQELQAIAAVAARYRILLLSDEIYGHLHHEGRHVSIATFYPEGTIVSSGLSKWCGAGGWRLGFFAFPRALTALKDAMAAVASETYTSTSAPIQYAAVRAFRGGMAIEQYLLHCRRILRALGRRLTERLCEAGAQVAPPQGAFYLFPDFAAASGRLRSRGITTSDELCDRLLEETGVALLPGSAFGRPPEELTARLSYVDFDGARALCASQEIPLAAPLDDAFLSNYCRNCVDAIDLIARWAQP